MKLRAAQSCELVLFLGAVVLVSATAAHAHEPGAPFSGAILDPLEPHHAHIENEERVNTFASRAREPNGGASWTFASELELSWSTD